MAIESPGLRKIPTDAKGVRLPRCCGHCPKNLRRKAKDARKRTRPWAPPDTGAGGEPIRVLRGCRRAAHRAARRRFWSRMDTGRTGGVIGGSECDPNPTFRPICKLLLKCCSAA